MDNTHPEGLPFAPEGAGWTEPNPHPAIGDQVARLLSERNIRSLQSHHHAEWRTLSADLATRDTTRRFDPATGRYRRSLTDNEERRLLALALLVQKGVVREELIQ